MPLPECVSGGSSPIAGRDACAFQMDVRVFDLLYVFSLLDCMWVVRGRVPVANWLPECVYECDPNRHAETYM